LRVPVGSACLAWPLGSIDGNPSVLEPEHIVGQVYQRRVMRGDQRGEALGMNNRPEEPHDLPAGLRVQLAGRLIGDQQLGAASKRPGDRDPLLLTAGQFVRALPGVLVQAHHGQHQRDPLPREPADRYR